MKITRKIVFPSVRSMDWNMRDEWSRHSANTESWSRSWSQDKDELWSWSYSWNGDISGSKK